MPTILTNFGPGYGPFVRTLDLARRIGILLENVFEGTVNIVVPLVFGEDQIRIVREEAQTKPDFSHRILLSQELGDCLKPLLFNNCNFNQYASKYLERYPRQQELWASLVNRRLSVIDIDGSPSSIGPGSVDLEVTRNPVLRSPIPFSYFTAIESQTSIFEATLAEPDGIEGINLGRVEEMLPVVDEMERGFRLHFLPTIRTLSWCMSSTRQFPDERNTPPLIPVPITPTGLLNEGFYVSRSGINGLDCLYDEALALPEHVYSNRIHGSIPIDQIIPPRFIAHPSIKWAYARAAWNSIWLANLTSTPLVCPTYERGDHPEIFFNNRTIEHLGLAAIWNRGNYSLEQFLENLDTSDLLSRQHAIYNATRMEFGTLDGIEYCSRQIAEDFIDGC